MEDSMENSLSDVENFKEKTEDIVELIIDMVRQEPSLYAKAEEGYHKEFKGRMEKFNIISPAIFQIYERNWSEQKIEKTWQAVVRKFKQEYKRIHSYKSSGSGNTRLESKWKHFKAMLFNVPHDKQKLPSIS